MTNDKLRLVWFEAKPCKRKRTKDFDDFEKAKAWAEANLHPHDVNGNVFPNVDERYYGERNGDTTYDGLMYEAGVFAGSNKYAVIVKRH